jgi:hypothetical protein
MEAEPAAPGEGAGMKLKTDKEGMWFDFSEIVEALGDVDRLRLMQHLLTHGFIDVIVSACLDGYTDLCPEEHGEHDEGCWIGESWASDLRQKILDKLNKQLVEQVGQLHAAEVKYLRHEISRKDSMARADRDNAWTKQRRITDRLWDTESKLRAALERIKALEASQ